MSAMGTPQSPNPPTARTLPSEMSATASAGDATTLSIAQSLRTPGSAGRTASCVSSVPVRATNVLPSVGTGGAQYPCAAAQGPCPPPAGRKTAPDVAPGQRSAVAGAAVASVAAP